MKASTAVLVAMLVGAGVGTGFWWGSHTVSNRQAAESPTSEPPARKVLHYRNPMGLDDTSPVPKKDSMGMDYIPVFEGDAAPPGTVRIGVDKVQKLGVRTEAAVVRDLSRTVRAVGTFQVDERRTHTVSPKFEGWIQRLHVNATGLSVRRGDPLMEVYSPDLVSAQQEYVIAVKGVQALRDADPATQASMKTLVESSLQRLRHWDISEAELTRLKQEGTARSSITLRSPAAGVVLEKPSVEGMRFMPGETLFRLADLSSLWLIAEVFEQDIAVIRVGQPVKIMLASYPDRDFSGKIGFIYPTVTPETRTAKVRIEVANPGGLLKPSMYASIEVLAGSSATRSVVVPESSVLDTGTRRIVIVERGEGLYEPREVKIGALGDGYVQIRDGVKEGDRVVVSANFLIDAESNLKAALGSFGSGKGAEGAAASPAPAMSPPTSSPAAPSGHAGHGEGR